MTAPLVVRAKVEEKLKATDAAEAAGELLRMRQLPTAGTYHSGDEAASSPPPLTGQPDSPKGTDVGTVVAKAKRAASSLWLILHAQNCNVTADRCPHTGCSDAKLILLHIKTCPAENCSDCPVQYKGCQQSRKLLAHYRKCRDIRARQNGASRRSAKYQPHVCLVCSLVARQARNVLDGTRAPAPCGPHKAARKTLSSSWKPTNQDSTVMVPRLDPAEPEQDMPPPPPRAPGSSAPIPIPMKQDANSDADETNQCESPPSAAQLMRPGLAALAAAAAPPSMMAGESTDPSLLSKSLDSSSKISFLIHASESGSARPNVTRRPRSESCHVMSPTTKPRPVKRLDDEYDPTLETDLTREEEPASIDEPKAHARRRSASLSLLSFSNGGGDSFDSAKGGQCDTIKEESFTSDEQVFLMEEDTEL